MLEAIGAVGVVAYAVVSLGVGVRLLALWRRTRQLPELAIGAGFFVGVLFGYVPENLALSTELVAGPARAWVLGVAQVAIRIAALAILVFTWRVFRPREAWAAGLVALVGLVLVGSWIVFPSSEALAHTPSERAASLSFSLSRSLCLVWGAAESALYWRAGVRRLRLGIADALVTDRFRLWSVALLASALIMASTLIARLVGVDATAAGWLLGESVVGLVAAAATWLTFFPTPAHRRRVQARALAL